MFPFIIKGKIPLGLRRDYHLSEAGLGERISERLVEGARRSEVRTDGSPSGDGRGLLAGGLSRLRSMGFLTAVRVRKIRIISRNDHLFARYEMDATASTLVCMVIIPLVLGSILFSHSAFGFYESLAILILLVLTSWGLDVLVLVMMLRHEIFQIASEIRAIMKRQDTLKIDPHHQGLSPEDLLATAYYYERNGLVRRCEAYLAHLTETHPDTLEASFAREHLETLEGLPRWSSAVRNREGEKRGKPSSGGIVSRIRSRTTPVTGYREEENQGRNSISKDHHSRFRIPGLDGRRKAGRGTPAETRRRSAKGSRPPAGGRWMGLFQRGSRETLAERVARKRRERLERREAYAKAPDEKSLSRGARMRLRLARLFRWEGREERRFRRKQERWLHGPRDPRPARRTDWSTGVRRQRRPNWMRSKEERQALERKKRWTEGPPGPGRFQRGRDRRGRWLLTRGRGGDRTPPAERHRRAADETTQA